MTAGRGCGRAEDPLSVPGGPRSVRRGWPLRSGRWREMSSGSWSLSEAGFALQRGPGFVLGWYWFEGQGLLSSGD